MVKERVRTLLTEPTDREIVKSHPLVSFINIGQRGRNRIKHQSGTVCVVLRFLKTFYLLHYFFFIYLNILIFNFYLFVYLKP